MKRLILAAPLALLVACGTSTEIDPGQWEFTMRMTEIDLPGVAEPMATQMRQAMANQTQTQQKCITPEEAANPTGGMMSQGSDPRGCTFSEQTFSGGRIAATGQCPAPTGGGNVRITMTGTYDRTSMTTQVRTETPRPPGAPSMLPETLRVSGTMTGRRTGDCSAT